MSDPLARLEASLAKNPTQSLDAEALAKLLNLRDLTLAQRILACLHQDLDGKVSALRLVLQLRALRRGRLDERLRFVFDLHDENGDGALSRAEVARTFRASLHENQLSLSPEREAALVDRIFQLTDKNGDNTISFAEFREQIERSTVARKAIASGCLAWLGEAEKEEREAEVFLGWADRWPRWLARGLYLLATLLLGLAAVYKYNLLGADVWIQIARFCGAGLDLHAMIVLMPVSRALITRLRRPLGHWLPLDDHLDMHRIIGDVAFGLAVVHSFAHLGHLIADQELSKMLLSWPHSTGLVWLGIYGVLWWFARERIRRSHRFELFQKTHLLYLPWLLLAVLHTPKLWPWLGMGLLVFSLDRLLRAQRHVFDSFASRLEPLASGVTLLEIARPPNFPLQVGDYVFVLIPALSATEWHPFTVSSAPERRDSLTVHVRTAGNWTGALYALAQRRRTVSHQSELPVRLDGPYGAPAGDVFRADVVVLVGAGIGVTPFAAVIESLMARSATERVPTVHFIWLLREQKALEWFVGVLGQAERCLPPGKLDLRIFLSSIRGDMDGGLLGMALDAHQQAGSLDPITGLRARTQCGKPDWDNLLGELASLHPNENIELFFCGPAGLGTTVRAAARRHRMRPREEQF